MLKDSDIPRYAVRRTMRTYSPETKAALLAACRAPGASIAAVASAHGMNANVLHRWLKEPSQTRGFCDASSVEMADQDMPAFIPVPLRSQPVLAGCLQATRLVEDNYLGRLDAYLAPRQTHF